MFTRYKSLNTTKCKTLSPNKVGFTLLHYFSGHAFHWPIRLFARVQQAIPEIDVKTISMNATATPVETEELVKILIMDINVHALTDLKGLTVKMNEKVRNILLLFFLYSRG